MIGYVVYLKEDEMYLAQNSNPNDWQFDVNLNMTLVFDSFENAQRVSEIINVPSTVKKVVVSVYEC